LKSKTTTPLNIIAITTLITVASLLIGFFFIQGKTIGQTLLTSAIIILIAGGSVAFLTANIMARSFKTLQELKQTVKDATEEKNCFLANISHEMRTPLNAIIGLSELMLHRDNLPPETPDDLEKIHSSGMTLLGIINDLLDISRIESGKFELIPAEYDVPSMINDTRNLNMLRIMDKPISFQIALDETLPSKLIGDELRVKQIFNNLLSNACHYTEKGNIEWSISWEQDEDKIWLISSVKDTGIGIQEKDIKKLFTCCCRNSQNDPKVHGSGLDLAIAHRMTEAMNGSITVSSTYGEGSTFTVRFQQKCASFSPIGAAVADTLKGRYAKSYATRKRMYAMKFARIAMPYAKVLIVDDVPTNLDVARGILKPYGMQVDCVNSGIEAIELIRNPKVTYDAIFMDHMMPEMDGIEAVRIIRKEIGSDYARNIPIIALTANAIIGNEEMFLKEGFQAFLSKPIDVMRMDYILRQWVRNKEREQKDEPLADSMSLRNAETEQEPDRIDHADEEEIPRIDGIDMQAGLNDFSGDKDIYLSVIRSYVDNTTRLITQLCNVTEETLADYAINIHGIKGSSYGIKAREIGEQAEELEHAAKAGDFQLVSRSTPLFIENAEKLLGALSGLLNAGTTDAKSSRHAPDETLLNRMEKAAENFNIDELEEIMKSLECFKYETQAELLIWLREKVNQMEFAAIRERLAQQKQNASEAQK